MNQSQCKEKVWSQRRPWRENAWEQVTLNSDWMKLWHNILGPIRNKKIWHQLLEVSNQPQHPQAMVVVSKHTGADDVNFDQLITISYFAFGGLNVTKGSRWVETIIVRYVFQLSWRSNLIVSAFFIMDMNVVPSCLADFHSYLLTQNLRTCEGRPNCQTTQKLNQSGANQLFNKSMSVHSTEREITIESFIPSDLFPVRILLIHASLYSSASFCLSVYFWCCRMESVRKYNLHICSFLFNTLGVLRRFEKPHRKVHFKIELCVAESTLRSKGSMSLTLRKTNELSCG